MSELTIETPVPAACRSWLAIQEAIANVQADADITEQPRSKQYRIAEQEQREAEQIEKRRREIRDRYGGERSPIRFLSSETLAASPGREWLVPGVIPVGSHGVFFGPEKSFKTSIAIDLAISGATGSKFLNEFEITSRFRSIVVSAESGATVLANDAETIARSKGTSLREIGDGVTWCTGGVDLSTNEGLDALKSLVWATDSKLLILDPAYRLLGTGSDSTDLAAMGRHLAPLAELAERRQCAVILVHHSMKGTDLDHRPPKLSDISGVGFGAWAACWQMVKPVRPRAGSKFSLWFMSGCRGGSPVDRVVEIDRGENGDQWRVTTATPDKFLETRRAKQKERRKEKATETKRQTLDRHKAEIIGVLSGLQSPESKSAIRATAGIGTAYFNRAWTELESEGVVRHTERTKNKRKEDCWSLAPIGATASS